MKLRKALSFIQEIGTIMYVGGILSHIVIGTIFKDANPETIYNIYTYKEQSAYILILPGLGIKIISDVILYFTYKTKPNWLKLKFLMVAFLSVNAFIFLVPMMPELVSLAKDSVKTGQITQVFIDKEHTEQFIGQLNVLPLILELILGSVKPKLGRKERASNFLQ